MKLYLQIAWRNLWRNKRRTLLAASSVFFAVILALIMRSMQHGTYDFMIDGAVRLYTGYIQIHGKGFWEERSLDKSILFDEEFIKQVEKIPNVTVAIPRLENFMLVSSQEVTKTASVVGIHPAKENQVTNLENKLIAGNYLKKNSDGLPLNRGIATSGILISEGLANLLSVTVGDSVVLYGQGLYGVTAAANVPIVGIVKFALPDLNNSMIYLSLPYSQFLFSMDGMVTTVSVMINNPRKLDDVSEHIENLFSDKYEVMKWTELMPELVQSIQLDSAGGIIMLFILYIVIAFGIFGTVMMMTAERMKEFGILISIGMKKWKLTLVTTLEAIFISFLGALAGTIMSIPILVYLKMNPIELTGELAEVMIRFGMEPIIPFSTAPGIFFAQASTVLIIALLTAFYPLNVIRKLEPIKAMRL